MRSIVKISLGFICLFLQLQLCAQSLSSVSHQRNYVAVGGTLSGRVTEKESKSGLASASVYIPDLKIGAVADSTGHYHFNALPAGTYLVEVRYVGFKPVTRNVTINGNTVVDFELANSTIEESAVVVTGLSKATQIRRSPIPIVAVDQEYLKTNF